MPNTDLLKAAAVGLVPFVLSATGYQYLPLTTLRFRWMPRWRLFLGAYGIVPLPTDDGCSCNVNGAFISATGTIAMASTVDLSTTVGRGWLAHELCHAAQMFNGYWGILTPAERESQCFALQHLYVFSQGGPSLGKVNMDDLTLHRKYDNVPLDQQPSGTEPDAKLRPAQSSREDQASSSR